MNPRPSILKIFTIDYNASTALTLLIFVIGLFVLLFYGNYQSAPHSALAIGLAALAVGALGALAWRLRAFQAVFEHGVEVKVTIREVNLLRDRLMVKYAYNYQGEDYSSTTSFMKGKRGPVFQAGQQMAALVDQNNPKQSFLRDLFV